MIMLYVRYEEAGGGVEEETVSTMWSWGEVTAAAAAADRTPTDFFF